MITGKQVVAARGLLEISQEELAKKAGVGISTLMRFERGETDARTNIRDAIEKTLNELGVDLVGGGVMPRKSMVEEFYSFDAYDRLEDEVWNKVRDTKSEILIFGYDELYTNEHTIKHANRLQENKNSQKMITHTGAKTALFPKDCYRFLDEDLYSLTPFLIYEGNLAMVYLNFEAGVDHIVIIRNKKLAESFKKIFNHLWKLGKKG